MCYNALCRYTGARSENGRKLYHQEQYSFIAQSVEHAAVNRGVVGSSPTEGADAVTGRPLHSLNQAT